MSFEPTEILKLDPWLEPHKGDIVRRHSIAQQWIKRLDQDEQGLLKFAEGYKYYGFNVDDKTKDIWYREWAPNAVKAYLIGDFNDWNRESHPMTKNPFGVWEIKLGAKNGQFAIPHNSKVKVMFHLPGGDTVDRLPAWITRVTQDLSVSPIYDAATHSYGVDVTIDPSVLRNRRLKPMWSKTLFESDY